MRKTLAGVVSTLMVLESAGLAAAQTVATADFAQPQTIQLDLGLNPAPANDAQAQDEGFRLIETGFQRGNSRPAAPPQRSDPPQQRNDSPAQRNDPPPQRYTPPQTYAPPQRTDPPPQRYTPPQTYTPPQQEQQRPQPKPQQPAIPQRPVTPQRPVIPSGSPGNTIPPGRQPPQPGGRPQQPQQAGPHFPGQQPGASAPGGARPAPPVNRTPVLRPIQPAGNGVAPRLPQRPQAIGQVLDPRSNGNGQSLRLPTQDAQGRPLAQRPLTDDRGRQIPPDRGNVTIMTNAAVLGNVRGVLANGHGWGWDDGRYHWFAAGGQTLCAWHDGAGFWWFGFYVGSVYFWTRYWNNNYWWYDPYWSRWDYYSDGYWWWQNPDDDSMVYVDMGGDYYDYNVADDGGAVLTPDPTPAPTDVPEGDASQPTKLFYSKDGTRMVQILDQNDDAYLYDTASPPSFQPVWLGSGVTDVKFSYGQDAAGNETLTQVLVLTSNPDQPFSAFDANGYALGANSSTGSGSLETPAPGSPTSLDQPTVHVFGSLSASPTLNALRQVFSGGW